MGLCALLDGARWDESAFLVASGAAARTAAALFACAAILSLPEPRLPAFSLRERRRGMEGDRAGVEIFNRR
jgi:hypothetical protein